jgi:hypothetical protein
MRAFLTGIALVTLGNAAIAEEFLKLPVLGLDQDTQALCRSQKYILPAEWARHVVNPEFSCLPEATGRQRVRIKLTLTDVQLLGKPVRQLQLTDSDYAGDLTLTIDAKIATLTPWVQRHVATLARYKGGEASRLEKNAGGFSVKTSEISRLVILPYPENPAQTSLSYRWAD